jgi:hypothetical protein
MAVRFLKHALGVGVAVAGVLLCAGISVQADFPGMPDYPWDLRKTMSVHYQAYLKNPAGSAETHSLVRPFRWNRYTG